MKRTCSWRRAGGALIYIIPVGAAWTAGCDRRGGEAAREAGSVVVYCSVDRAFAEPILAEYASRSGTIVHRVYDTEAGKTTGLVNKLLAERAVPRADVWWSGEIFGTMQLARAGVLAEYAPAPADDLPEGFRDSQNRWTAQGLRGRVVAYDPRRTRREDAPKTWAALAEPRYRGRVALADPRYGTTRGHMAALAALWGEAAVRDYFAALRRNDCRIVSGNADAVLHVARGEVEFAATDTDDVIVAQQRGDVIEAVYPDLDAPGGGRRIAGTLWIPCSVGLVQGAPRPEAGQRLVDYLASAEIEERLHASASRNAPVRAKLRERLGIVGPTPAAVDYAAAGAALDLSDRLVRDNLLQ